MKLAKLDYEIEIWKEGGLACGIDEVGRGCLAGPVVAAAVIIPKDHKPIDGIRDSKKICEEKRKKICEEILGGCADFGIGLVPANEIDSIGIVSATKAAMRNAIDQLKIAPDLLLIDAVKLDDVTVEQIAIVRGDEECYSIACASIVAKVFRDSIISGLDNIHPQYEFSAHKGYGTKKHKEAIIKHGLISEHRKSYLKKYSNN